MAKNQLTIDQLRAEAVKPLFAVAGATEFAIDYAREGFAGINKVDRDPKALQAQARTLVNARVDQLTKEAKDAQAKFEARIAELQKDAKSYPGRFQSQVAEALAELTASYADLASRGEKFVAAIRKDGVKAVTAVKKAPSSSTVVRREKARAASSTTSTKKAPAKRSTAKKSPAKKSTAKKTTSSSNSSSTATSA
jgi:hypothetical protein